MKDKETTAFKQNWYTTHTLTPRELDKLIKEKIERARVYHEAEQKRKALFAESR